MRTVRWSFVCLLLVVVGLGLAACGSSSGSASNSATVAQADSAFAKAGNVPFAGPELQVARSLPDPKPQDLTISFLNPRASNESLHTISEGLRIEVEKLGGHFNEYDANLDVDTQVSQFQQALAQNVDGIAILPLDPRALAPSLNQAGQKGIPVVGAAVDPANPNGVPGYKTDVWEGHDRLAYEQVKQMAKLVPPGTKVALIGSVIPVPALTLTTERERYWAQKFGLDVVGQANNPTDDIAGGEQAMTQILSKYPDAKGILPYNDESAVGASAAARAAGKRDDTVIVGINGGSLGFGAVKDGRLEATIQTQEVGVGVLMAKALYLAKEQPDLKLPPALVTNDPVVVTPDNVDELPQWTDQLKALETGN